MNLKFEKLGLKRSKIYGKLFVSVVSAKGLPFLTKRSNSLCSVRVSLLPGRYHVYETKRVKYGNNSTWNDVVTYNLLTLEELAKFHAIEMYVLEYTSSDHCRIIGSLCLGPTPNLKDKNRPEWMDSNALESSHWEQMVSWWKWVECCHTLRPSIKDEVILRLALSQSSDILSNKDVNC